MKITIDDKVCLKKKLSVEETLIALAVRYSKNFKETYENLINRGVLLKDDENTYLATHWNDILDEIIYDSNGGATNDERLTNLAKQLQSLFPAGKMPGTPYYYKSNTREVAAKLKKFFEIYGNYSDEDVINATKRYIASFNGNYKFLPMVKYFILKNKSYIDDEGMPKTVLESPLATFLENKTNENVATASDDWLMNVRN